MFTFYLVIGAFDSIYYAQYIIDSSYLFHTSFTTDTIPFYLIILKKKKTKKKGGFNTYRDNLQYIHFHKDLSGKNTYIPHLEDHMHSLLCYHMIHKDFLPAQVPSRVHTDLAKWLR